MIPGHCGLLVAWPGCLLTPEADELSGPRSRLALLSLAAEVFTTHDRPQDSPQDSPQESARPVPAMIARRRRAPLAGCFLRLSAPGSGRAGLRCSDTAG